MAQAISGQAAEDILAEDFHPIGSDPAAATSKHAHRMPLPPGYQNPAGTKHKGAPEDPQYVPLDADSIDNERPLMRTGHLTAIARQRAAPELQDPPWSVPSLLLALVGWSFAATAVVWLVLSWVTGQIPGL